MHLLLCGHGYLGEAVSRRFLAAGWSVTAVSKTQRPEKLPGIDERTADLAARESLSDLAASITRPDFIVHCAASGRGGAEAYRAVYLGGCENLLAIFPDTPLLFTSSTSVYAQTDGSVVTEESAAEPDRETGQILRRTEAIVRNADGIVFRLAGIYGPSRSAILKKFIAGKSTLEEDGRRFINQIHRDDAASAILHAATLPLESGTYNVCDSSPRSQLETFKALCGKFGQSMPPVVARDLNRKRGWTHKRVSNAKLIASGWKPAYPDSLDAAAKVAETLDEKA